MQEATAAQQNVRCFILSVAGLALPDGRASDTRPAINEVRTGSDSERVAIREMIETDVTRSLLLRYLFRSQK